MTGTRHGGSLRRARAAAAAAAVAAFRSRRVRFASGAAIAIGIALLAWVRLGPLPHGLLDERARPSIVVEDRHGERLYEARSSLGLRGEWIEAHEVPALVARATMAAEDERFHRHPGVDPIAVLRAAWRNIRAGGIEEGGSTISQQVAKLLLSRLAGGAVSTGWRAKLYEATVALRLEHRISKADILALYVNLAPYGNQIEGIARASRAYFGRDVGTLTPAEAAFLAALPQQPGRFNPWRHPDRASARQARVIDTMAARGWLAPAEARTARAEHLTMTREDAAHLAPHFVERTIERHGTTGTRHIVTTLDAALQRTVQGIIGAQRASLDRHHAANVAVVVLDNESGDWLAWEGSGNWFDAAHGGTIDGAIAPRQPGSALKPFTYAAAFERGFDPGHVLADVPSQFPTDADGVMYSPRNYDGRFRGPMRARTALAGSENVPAVALAAEVGVPVVARLLRRAGLTSLDNNAAHYGLGLTLGNAEVRLDELVNAYAMFARGGRWMPARMILAVDGQAPAPAAEERVLSERTAFWITDILSDAEARAYAFGRGGSLEFPFPVAAKTGTSQSYFDNWVVGYTREVTVGVWVGNFDRTPLRGSSGITGAGPIFHAVMLAAVERARGGLLGAPDAIATVPHDLERHEICALSGMAAGAACPTRASEWLPAAGERHACTWHHATDTGLVTVWPDVYREWARENGLEGTFVPAAALDPGAALDVRAMRADGTRVELTEARRASEGLTIVRPLAGALFMIDPTLRPEFQMLALAARGGRSPLRWFVNGDLVATGRLDETVRWPLARGRHEILVRDAAGQTARTRVDVR